MKRVIFIILMLVSEASFGRDFLNTCEYAQDVQKRDNPVVYYPARVGGCIGHVAGYGVGLLLASPLAVVGAERGVEVIVAASGEQGNKTLNYIFGLPGNLLLQVTGEK